MKQCRMLQEDIQKVEDPSSLTGVDAKIYKRQKHEYKKLIDDSDSDD